MSGTAGGADGRPARVAGRYLIESEIARGGMAIIYRAFDESTQGRVVLKRLRPELVPRENIAMLFQREYYTLAQLSHPRIIEVYDYGVDADGPYYTMELLDGQDLRELAPLPWREACGYIRDVASSLALLHTRRLLHRDLGPRNVRRTEDGHVKLFDFGTMASFGVPPDLVGTPPFVPPEALRGVPLDHRADLYSLGALSYWLLTRRHPFRAKRMEDLAEAWRHPPPPPSQFCEVLPKELEDLVLSLLSMDPGARCANAADVIERLTAIAGPGSEEVERVADGYLLSSSLVGRWREMRRLLRWLDRAAQGRGSAVLIEANPGVGRSRLLYELSLKGQLAGALVVSVAAEARAGPYALARGVMRGLFRNAPSDTRHAAAPYVPILGHLLPELQASSAELAVLPEDAAELRVRQQTALLAVILELARERPLVIIADDFHRSDEPSAALLAALAQYCPSHPLFIVCGIKLGSVVTAPEALRALRGVARSVRLHRLGRADTLALVESLFGSVPNVDRLAGWIHDITTGNCTQTMELARHLVDTRRVEYSDGLWGLPMSLGELAVPSSLGQALTMRLATLGPDARALASLLCVRETAAPLALVAAVAPRAGPELFGQLQELVRKGVLESSGDGYRFVHDAMRVLLLDQLSPADRQAAHRHMGEALLQGSQPGKPEHIHGAWHLMRGGDAERGAQLVAGAVRATQLDRQTLPAIEEAVHILERDGSATPASLNLRSILTMSGYFHERRLAYEYGPETVKMLYRDSGLALARRLATIFGRKLGLWLGLLLSSLARVVPWSRRRPGVARSLRYFSRAVAPLFGAMTVGIDVEGVRRLYPMVQPLSGFARRDPAHIVFLFCRALRLLMEGREAEHRKLGDEVIALLDEPKVAFALTQEHRRDLLVGTMMPLGISEAYFATGRGLQLAERIEALGTHFGQVAAHRVRFTHHLMRGESELAEPHRREVELHAVQGGSTWQVELWSLAIEGLAAHVSEDHIRFKQLAQSVSRMLEEVPSLRIYHSVMECRLQRRTGNPEAGLARLEELATRMPVRRYMGWDVVRLALSELLLGLDRPGRAQEVCAEAVEGYRSDDELHVIRIMLERQHAVALAAMGHMERARGELATLIARVAPTRHPLLLARLHEAACQLALMAGDGEAAATHLSKMERAVEPTRNPALLALFQSAAQAVRASGLGAGVEVDEDDDEPMTQAHGPMDAQVSRLLDGIDEHEWPERLLRLLLSRAQVSGGYLYVWQDDELQLAARTLPEDPPDSLLQRIVGHVEDAVEDAETGGMGLIASGLDSDAPGMVPFQLLLLPAPRSGRPPSGVVALLCEGETPRVPSPAFLRAVAQHLSRAS